MKKILPPILETAPEVTQHDAIPSRKAVLFLAENDAHGVTALDHTKSYLQNLGIRPQFMYELKDGTAVAVDAMELKRHSPRMKVAIAPSTEVAHSVLRWDGPETPGLNGGRPTHLLSRALTALDKRDSFITEAKREHKASDTSRLR